MWQAAIVHFAPSLQAAVLQQVAPKVLTTTPSSFQKFKAYPVLETE